MRDILRRNSGLATVADSVDTYWCVPLSGELEPVDLLVEIIVAAIRYRRKPCIVMTSLSPN